MHVYRRGTSDGPYRADIFIISDHALMRADVPIYIMHAALVSAKACACSTCMSCMHCARATDSYKVNPSFKSCIYKVYNAVRCQFSMARLKKDGHFSHHVHRVIFFFFNF